MLRPTFLSFETAKRALSTSQRGLDTVGHNISNVNTPGYTRQRVDQVSIASSGYKAKYVAYNSQFPGMGSDVIGINQIRDPHLDKRYRTEAATVGEKSAISDGLAEINAIFDEIQKEGLHAKMDEFLYELDRLSAQADTPENASVLRNLSQQMAQILNKNYKDLEHVTTQQQSEMQYTVDDVNIILEQIANLNVKIKEDNFYGNPANELNDERNLLVDQLSELLDINVKRTPVKITEDLTIQQISIELKNTSPPVELVNSGRYNGLEVKFDENSGEASVFLVDGISKYAVNLPGTDDNELTDLLYSGAVKGHLDVLNGKGQNAVAGEKSFRGLPHYKAALDVYAKELADRMNELNRVKVLEYDGANYTEKWIDRPLFVSSEDGTYDNITASNISVNQNWLDDPLYITTKAKNNALVTDAGGNLLLADGTSSGFTLADIGRIGASGVLMDVNDPTVPLQLNGENLTLDDLRRAMTVNEDGYSIGDEVPTTLVPGDSANDNLVAMKLMLESKNNSFPGFFTGSFQEYLVNYQSDMSLDKKSTDTLLTASLQVLSGLSDSRDSISAVSTDEEAINMMVYQNYYNAAARYMTVLDEALGTIIQGMGVVGR